MRSPAVPPTPNPGEARNSRTTGREPEVKHEEAPELIAVIPSPSIMFGEHARGGRWVAERVDRGAGGRQRGHPVLERASNPFADGDAEPLLLLAQYRGGDKTFDG